MHVEERAAVSQEVLDIDGGEDRFLRARSMQDNQLEMILARGCRAGSVMCMYR